MKKPIVLLAGIMLSLGIFYLVRTQKSPVDGSSEMSMKSEEENEEGERTSGAGKALSMFWWTRAYPDPYHINSKYMAAWKKAQQMKKEAAVESRVTGINAGAWTPIGPRTLGGRMLCIAVNPLKHTTVIAGSATGGMFRSYTSGVGLEAWTPIPTGFPALGVTSILYHPTDTNIIYAATGELYRTDSTGTTPNPNNTALNVWKTRGTYSVGLLKSIDGGADWEQAWSLNLANLTGIQRIRFDPTNANIVFIAASDGLYKYNATTGVTIKMIGISYVSDVLINPLNNAQIVIAVGNLNNTLKGIYRTTNANAATPTWTRVGSVLPAATAISGYIKLDIHPASNTIYAGYGTSASATTEIYRSTDFGATWSGFTGTGHSSYQYWFSHNLAVDPNNVNTVVAAGVNAAKYTLGATSATASSLGSSAPTMNTYLVAGAQEGGNRYIHSDIHEIEYVPGRSDSLYIIGDGGIHFSRNANLVGTSVTWETCNSGLQTTQFYGPTGQSTTDANFFVGGLQDNNTAVYDGALGRWKRIIGGDGGPAAVHPTNDQIVMMSRDARAVYKSSNKTSTNAAAATYWGSVADSRTGFCAPLAFSKSNPTIVYLASDNLHKSTNTGTSFSGDAHGTATTYIEARHKTAVALAVSPTNENKLWVSISPFAQFDGDVDDIHYNPPANFFRSTNGGTSWTNVYTGLPTPNRYVMDIAVHPTNDNILWVTLGGFGSSHVFKSIDGGTTWTDIDNGNLPDVPTTAILVDPARTNTIYVGNDIGVYVSGDGGVTWTDFSGGLWDATMITDLHMIPGNKVRAATYGKGIFDSPKFTPSLLPVNLISFTGTEQGTQNQLKWTVDQEINMSRYELERSSNGVNYQTITSIASRNSLTQSTYTYNDAAGNTTYYYRLRMVNSDGSDEYSKVVLIRRKSQEGMVVRGAVRNSVDLTFTLNQSASIRLNLYDATGRLLRKETLNAQAGQTPYSISNIGNLPSGVYEVEAVVNNNRWTKKVVKE
jgi:hypothetical protein